MLSFKVIEDVRYLVTIFARALFCFTLCLSFLQ